MKPQIPGFATDALDALSAVLTAYVPFLGQPELRLALVLLVVGLVAAVVLPGRPTYDPRRMRQDDVEDAPRASNTPLWRRLWWRVRPPHDLMRVDGLVIDRSRKPHALWLGPTGAGKSASVATVRVNGQRPTLVVTPDLSDPLLSATHALGGFVWTAGVSSVPVNFLLGSPGDVAERLTEVFRSGGTGVWKRTARQATRDVIETLDRAGMPRTLKVIAEGLRAATATDRELKQACAGWVARFADVAEQFGSSIGPDGVDLADLLRAGQTVLLDNDSFDHPALGGDVVAFGLAEAKRCASLVPGGFRLIFEEAGQLGERIDLADPFFRAGRRRKISVDALTQAESDLKFAEGIGANTATRVYFGQELIGLQKVAADRLGIDHKKLDVSAMRDFTAWIAHGKIRRLVRFPKPPGGTLPQVRQWSSRSYAEGDAPSVRDYGFINPENDSAPRVVIQELPSGPVSLPRLPAPKPRELPAYVQRDPDRLSVFLRLADTAYDASCWAWTGGLDNDGYGRVGFHGRTERVHVLMLCWSQGLPLEEFRRRAKYESATVDHLCNNTVCANPRHLQLVSNRTNVQRMHERRKARIGR